MWRRLALFVVVLWIAGGESAAVPKIHVISFGKWMSVKWPDATGKKLLDLKVRPLYVDTLLKEYTTGPTHEVTDRLFAVRRVFRLNEALPEENAARWQWQRGGWLLVDRVSGKVSQLSLPEFDPFYSTASWYRDYVAYCGVSEDGKKLFAVVVQVGRRRPILKKAGGRTGRRRRTRLRMPCPNLGKVPGAGYLPARRCAETDVFDPRTGGGHRE